MTTHTCKMGQCVLAVIVAALILCAAVHVEAASAQAEAKAVAGKVGAAKGFCVVLGLGEAGAALPVALAKDKGLMVYFQSDQSGQVAAVRAAAESAGVLGAGLWADQGDGKRIQLARNLADVVVAAPTAKGIAKAELLRVLRPGGVAVRAGGDIVKPVPAGIDTWSHPYHGPDNNPQSTDRVARGPYLTQFLAKPLFSSQPEVTVAAGGRLFKAFGHIAFRSYQDKMINTLIGMNAYNGVTLWQRKLEPGFMVHRNTMIATDKLLYIADDESCKLIDGATGKLVGQIAPPADVAGGTVWKWMALDGDVLYALIGGKEVKAPIKRGRGGPGVSGWPWSMWPGYDYKDAKSAWGFGRTLLAIDTKTKRVLWSHREDEPIDGRAVCMKNGRIYYYCRQKLLGCLNAKDGKEVWRTSNTDLIEAIGADTRAQRARFGFTTSAYMKVTDKVILFAGPQRAKLVAASVTDGGLLWERDDGNFQLVLRGDVLYAMGSRRSLKINSVDGKVLKGLKGRQACTRATGSIDSIFVRGSGTVRLDVATDTVQHISPMRPACQDGVVISGGQLYWGPWICGCNLALFGVASLGPAGDFDFKATANESRQLVRQAGAAGAGAAGGAAGTTCTLPPGPRRSRTFVSPSEISNSDRSFSTISLISSSIRLVSIRLSLSQHEVGRLQRQRTELPPPARADQHVVFKPYAADSGQVNPRLDGNHHPGPQPLCDAAGQRRPFVDRAAQPVTQRVHKLVAVSGRLDDVAGGGVHVAAARPRSQRPNAGGLC
ncbi:hypothetical protein LCGC14_1520180, partial [marine sediment metagenome]